MRPPGKHTSSSRGAVYRHESPAQSTTSLSDDDDNDDFNKSTFYAPSEPVAVSPAQWSKSQFPHPGSPTVSGKCQSSPASRLPPEILIHILKHLHSSRDLYHTMLVCRGWCECSVELLWHRPNFSKLDTLGKMMRALSKDDQTFLYARFIRRLNFLYLGKDLNDILFTRLTQCVRLERLTLINCNELSDGALARVLPCCPNLVALDLTGVEETSDRAIVALASSTKRLQGINLGGCKKVTDQGLLALAANCPLLRRVKLSGVEKITDEAVSALAKSCPLLLELDLNHCKLITDVSIRDLWLFSGNMRELRLSHCVELTDSAFPAPVKPEIIAQPGLNPFPSNAMYYNDRLPPLHLTRSCHHLRMLDLTGCCLITDDAVEGIASAAPKIRNLVLAKCTLLTDRAVEAICSIGKHLHYLHLGHAGSITDRSIRSLARACTRLRYIDLANCMQLTDMSVFELSGLQKLRRIGLVRVRNLTDQAIYSLAERHSTLERIHLSYCDQISVMAIHYLLQKLLKLTHLSLTGVTAFRRPELQRFCRDPPNEFNDSQRSAFCVYSGKGVSQLRDFLAELFNTITDEITGGSGTEYDDDEDMYIHEHVQTEIVDDGDDDEEDEDEEEEEYVHHGPVRHGTVTFADHRTMRSVLPHPNNVPMDVQPRYSAPYLSRELLMSRDHASTPVARNSLPSLPLHSGNFSYARPVAPTPTAGPSRRGRGFGQHPIIEASTSPTPSEAASNRSGGTNHSTGTAFFRNYQEAHQPMRTGVITPDLVFAEIGHGRGADHAFHNGRWSADSVVLVSSPPHNAAYGSMPMNVSAARAVYNEHTNGVSSVFTDSSNSFTHPAPRPDASSTWTLVPSDTADSNPATPTTRELQDSVQSALGSERHGYMNGQEADARERSVKRSLRNTISAAEQYASSFFLGRGPNGHPPDDSGSSSRHRSTDFHSQ
ncbi:RNI-like protein [Trametopsis cervina]|nr:RNI-like protein [Trametopsis cervina]